jgi:hypothetical protein
MTDKKKIVADFQATLKVIEAQAHMLKEARSPSGITSTLDSIVQHLSKLTDAQIVRLRATRTDKERIKSLWTKAASMTLEDVELALEDERTTRVHLEAIAVGRFQVPSGSLRSLQNVGFLREKIKTMAQNERAHETISNVAKDTKF